MSKPKQKQTSTTTQSSLSRPLGPDELTDYFSEINSLTKGARAPGGRLFQFARSGTPAVNYKAPTNAQIKGLGGFGATRKADVERARAEELEQIMADPSLSVFQNRRSRQLVNQDAATSRDAINQEIEAAIAEAAFERAAKQYDSGVRNSDRLREDMALLAEIFFGGKGQETTSEMRSDSKYVGKPGFLDQIGNLFSVNFQR